MQEQLLSTKEAAERLTLTERTLRYWRVRGKGPRYVKLGNKVRYTDRDLAVFVERMKRGGQHE